MPPCNHWSSYDLADIGSKNPQLISSREIIQVKRHPYNDPAAAISNSNLSPLFYNGQSSAKSDSSSDSFAGDGRQEAPLTAPIRESELSHESDGSHNIHRQPTIIIGIVVTLVLILIAVLLFFLWRRHQVHKDKSSRRITFHRELMVQQPRRLPPPLLDIQGPDAPPPRIIVSSPRAMPIPPHSAFINEVGERKNDNNSTPRSPKSARPPPPLPARPSNAAAGPGPSSTAARAATKRPEPLPLPPVSPYELAKGHGGPTERQSQLRQRVRQLEEVMNEIRNRPGMLRVLDQLRVQVAWLRSQMNSPWAMGETDVPPQHFDMYMGR